jgi:nuclease S1
MPGNIQPLRWLFLALAVSMFNTSPAYPWGSRGHEIVAVLAETQLTDIARKCIKELLPQGTTLADASTWPDKAGRQIPDMDAYHLINLPKDVNAYDQQRDCKLRNCIIEAIAWYLQVLKSPDAPRNEKRIALRFVATSLATFTSRSMPGLLRIAAATVLR